jgi:hypothetical protein
MIQSNPLMYALFFLYRDGSIRSKVIIGQMDGRPAHVMLSDWNDLCRVVIELKIWSMTFHYPIYNHGYIFFQGLSSCLLVSMIKKTWSTVCRRLGYIRPVQIWMLSVIITARNNLRSPCDFESCRYDYVSTLATVFFNFLRKKTKLPYSPMNNVHITT